MQDSSATEDEEPDIAKLVDDLVFNILRNRYHHRDSECSFELRGCRATSKSSSDGTIHLQFGKLRSDDFMFGDLDDEVHTDDEQDNDNVESPLQTFLKILQRLGRYKDELFYVEFQLQCILRDMEQFWLVLQSLVRNTSPRQLRGLQIDIRIPTSHSLANGATSSEHKRILTRLALIPMFRLDFFHPQLTEWDKEGNLLDCLQCFDEGLEEITHPSRPKVEFVCWFPLFKM